MLLMIDNYDSFTYNLVQYLSELEIDVTVERNDHITLEQIETLAPSHIMISPGPGTPDDAGISLALIKKFSGTIPILGICLGHQAIAQCFGGQISHARRVMHGKTSQIYHQQKGVFTDCPLPLTATRYHSLIVDKTQLPACFEITAWTQTAGGDVDEIMGIRHRHYALEGVQFHPESILTQAGHQLLKNFVEWH